MTDFNKDFLKIGDPIASGTDVIVWKVKVIN